jgi:hypothetical protein
VKITHQIVVFDAADLPAESSFWAGVLGGTVDAEDDWHMVEVDGQPRIGVQLAPNHVPPDWPDGSPQQIHLDLWVDDPAAAHDLVMSLGARVLKEAEDGLARHLPGVCGPRRPSLLPLLGQAARSLEAAVGSAPSRRFGRAIPMCLPAAIIAS